MQEVIVEDDEYNLLDSYNELMLECIKSKKVKNKALESLKENEYEIKVLKIDLNKGSPQLKVNKMFSLKDSMQIMIE